jgi:stage III sporulation protein AH
MKKVWKKRAVVATVLVFVCAAVYLNWRYTGGVEDTSKILGQSTLVSTGEETEQETGQEAGQETAAPVSENDYFATARLSRKQARDNAISMLKEAEVDENAAEDVLNEASETLQVLASYTVAESQIESLVTAKGYADCVAFMGADSISVVVSDPDGLDSADVARIKDIVVNETDYTPQQIKIMEAN